MGWSFLILLLSITGFALSTYIHTKKQREQPLACPLKGNCHAVVSSEYSRFFGIPVECLGMLYYALVTLGYAVIIASPAFISAITSLLVPVTEAAVLFSLYLTFIQLFSLRQLCTWCIFSALLCLGIFTAALLPSIAIVVPLLMTISIPLIAVLTLVIVLNAFLVSRRLR